MISLWLNIPPIALAFTAMVGIPLWVVLRHPDGIPAAARPAPTRQVQAVESERVLVGASAR